MMKITAVLSTESANASVVIEQNGKEVKKTISINDYRRICSELNVAEGQKVRRVGELPAGFYDGGVNEDVYEAIIKLPGGKRPLFYHAKEYFLPFPDVVFYFKATSTSGNVTSSKVWFLDREEKLFKYPYGNVYQDGSICWGGNVLPRIRCLKDFEKLVTLFFSAATNEHLYKETEALIDGKKVVLMQRELIDYVSKKEDFPMDLLVPYGRSIKEL